MEERRLRVGLVQSMLHWEDAAANRRMFGEKLRALQGHADLVVLPEMFTTGFSMRASGLAERMDGPTVDWMRQQANTLGACLYGSVIIGEEGRYYNRGLFVEPGGAITAYDKRHLFSFAGEHEHFSPGKRRVVVSCKGWRILLQICYDLRFPVFSRNRGDHDAVLYVANWPEARRHPWSQLLVARAMENLVYVVGLNRVGMDGKGIHYTGDTVVLDPRGMPVPVTDPEGRALQWEGLSGRECVSLAELDGDELQAFREKFPALQDADNFRIEGL
jgi:predicted amidohydrolase